MPSQHRPGGVVEWGPESCIARTVRVRSAERSVPQGGDKWAPHRPQGLLPAPEGPLRVPTHSWKLAATHLSATRDDFVMAQEIMTFPTNGDEAGRPPALGRLFQ